MRLVEAIPSKLLQQIENLIRLVLGDSINLRATRNERGALLGHFFELLLAHGAAQQIRAAQRVSRQDLG